MKISLLLSVATGIYIHNIISNECEKRLTLEKEDKLVNMLQTTINCRVHDFFSGAGQGWGEHLILLHNDISLF